MSKKKILITGHLGFIGHALFVSMANSGHYIDGMDIQTGRNILTAELPEADIVIHLAAQSEVVESVKDPMNDALVNIVGTIRLLQHYKNARFIFISSEGAIQETIESPYGMSKLCAEEYIKLLCKDYVILRLPNVYGDPDSGSVVDLFINGEVKVYGNGSQTRDYVHVLDVVDAIKQSLEWVGGTYHLGSLEYHTVQELAETTGKPITYLPKRPGELQHTPTQNNTEWRPKIEVLDYIKKNLP
jgi:UDP-glucose 4-epimerase